MTLKKCSWLRTLLLFLLLAHTTLAADMIVETDGRFEKYADGVVVDVKTGLEWYPGPDSGTTWDEAKNWVIGLEVAGGGWRMPTKGELETLFHLGDGVSNITPLLKNSGYWVWAGETQKTSSMWTFSFSYGGEGWEGASPPDGGRGFAVRAGK